MTLLKKFFIVSLLISFACSSALAGQSLTIEQKLASLEKVTGKFTFAVIGDNRSGDDVYKKIIGMAMERKPDFVVNVGDLIYTPGSLPEWKQFRELSGPISVPYFLAIGNHDVSDKKSEETYKGQVDLPGNELYYSFSCGNSLFIVLDSSVIGQYKKITGEQLAWLENVLEHTDKLHKFIFIHHPLYPERLSFSGSLDSNPKERDILLNLLVKHRVEAVFAGHLHLYLRKSFKGVTQIITGGAGAPLIANEENGGFFHFIIMTVDNETVSGEVIDTDGTIRDKFTLNIPKAPGNSN